MPTRRSILTSLSVMAFAAPFSANGASLRRPALRRYGDLFILDGWVLTRRDIEDLGLDAD